MNTLFEKKQEQDSLISKNTINHYIPNMNIDACFYNDLKKFRDFITKHKKSNIDVFIKGAIDLFKQIDDLNNSLIGLVLFNYSFTIELKLNEIMCNNNYDKSSKYFTIFLINILIQHFCDYTNKLFKKV